MPKPITVREARRRRNLTQEQLALLAGVRQNVISQLETGRTANPGIALVLKVARALEMPVEQLSFDVHAEEHAQ